MFIRYDQKTKGYKLFDADQKKFVVSRDVLINKADSWDWKKTTNAIEKLELEKVSVSFQKGSTSSATEIDETTNSDAAREEGTSFDEEEENQKMRNLQDIYDETSELQLICFMADAEAF